MATSVGSKPRHRGTWIVALVGLLEIAAAVAFFEVKGVANTVCGYAATAQGASGSLGVAPPPAAGGLPAGGSRDDGSGGAASPVTAASAAAPADAAAPAAGGDAGDARVSGDTNQIVDPNCVGKAAAALLSEATPGPAAPTCGPMKQPEALKAAEREIQK